MGYDRDQFCRRHGAPRRVVQRLATLVLAGWMAATGEMSAQQPAPTASRPLVFDGVTVVDVEQGKLVLDQRVVITGNRIQAMGRRSTVATPKRARVVNARGKYLIPGLWDLHIHAKRYTDFFYPLLIANGVTGIRDAGSNRPLDKLLLLQRRILTGTLVGPPRQLLAGIGSADTNRADAERYVDSLKAAGANFIKAYPLSFAIAAAARHAGLPFGGHVIGISAMDASDSGTSILDHVTTAGGMTTTCWGPAGSAERCQPVAERLARNNTWFVPTITRYLIEKRHLEDLSLGPNSDSIFARFKHRAAEFWAGSKLPGNWLRDSVGVGTPGLSEKVAPANSSGVMALIQRLSLPVLAGTDVGSQVLKSQPPGFSLHAELALYVGEGLTPLTALQAATLNPAKLLHGTDSLGTVAPGKLADLVLLDADPLADITNTTTIRAVVANGRYFDRAALDKLLATVTVKAKKEQAAADEPALWTITRSEEKADSESRSENGR